VRCTFTPAHFHTAKRKHNHNYTYRSLALLLFCSCPHSRTTHAHHTEAELKVLLQQDTVDVKAAQELVDSAPEGPAKVRLQRVLDEAKEQNAGVCVALSSCVIVGK
jgi:hypothetical protein